MIDFGLYDIFDKTSEKVSQTFYLFSTQFYTNLTSRKKLHESALLNKTEAARQHWNVRRWTRNIDIFGKRKILLFPVNEVSPCPHWYLIMVLIPDTRQDTDLLPFIAVLDSVGGKRDVEVVNIKNYLLEELKVKTNQTNLHKLVQEIEIQYPVLPRQADGSSCGLYLIFYVRQIVESFKNKAVSDILKDTQTWFKQSEINRMRFELACKIITSAALQGKDIKIPSFQLFDTAAEDKAEKRKWSEISKVKRSYSDYMERVRQTKNDITLRGKYYF